jgi:hypothetical protein
MSEPEKKSGRAFGFREIIVLLLIVGFFTAIAMPRPIGPRRSSPAWNANACINNLRQIDAAANQFALEHHLTNGDAINFPNDLTPYIKLNNEGKIPGCPQGGIYHIGKVGETPACSLSNAVPPHVLPQ